MKNLKQTLCGDIALVSLFLLIVLTVHYAEADRYGQAILTAAGGLLTVHIAAKLGGLYWEPEERNDKCVKSERTGENCDRKVSGL